MKRNEKRIPSIIPEYAHIPLLLVTAVAAVTYYGTRLITPGFIHYDLTLPIDARIPFVPAFSVIYILAYVQWIVGFILIARESREVCYRVLAGEIIAKMICLLLFIALPTTMVRAELPSRGFFSKIVGCIYAVDAPDNLFPSIHCLESMVCLHGALHMRKVGKWYGWFSLLCTLLVFASTVLIKQHVICDVAAGIAVCEIGQWISWHGGRMLRRWIHPISRWRSSGHK